VILDEAKLEELIERAVDRVLDRRMTAVEAGLLTKEQVAVMLGVTPRTITTYQQREGMPYRKRPGGHCEYNRAEVLTWWRDRGKVVPPLKAVP
jgi:hypothetical protein